jgi:hypothetical protein
MKRDKLCLTALAVIARLALLPGLAAALSKPITACGMTVSAPGSYVVSANLTATSTSVPCIQVNAGGVNIDLGGFVLTGKRGASGYSRALAPWP